MQADLAPRALGDGLVLRAGTQPDIEPVADLMGRVFRDREDEPFNEYEAAWVRDLGSGLHPYTDVAGCLLVEDTRAGGKIAAALWLIPVVWTFGGIRFGVGRPEEVGTDPAYRRRGLIRALFEAFHARSAAAGELAQAITGIPYFYRQFGYEFAVDHGGGRTVAFADIPALREGEVESYHLREAREADLPLVMELYRRDRQQDLVAAEIDLPYWRWALDRAARDPGQGWRVLLIVDRAGAPRGYVLPRCRRWGRALGIIDLAVQDGVSLAAVLRPLLRGLRDVAARTPATHTAPPADRIAFALGADHPLYTVLGDALAPRRHRPYAWYVRVPDRARFIRHIAPVLEGRLAASPLAGHSGELRLDFYRGGLRLVFADGRLATAEEWRRPLWGPEPAAGFPPLVFLQMLFGRRSLDDLRDSFPDVWAADADEPLLRTLFPPQPSHLMELD